MAESRRCRAISARLPSTSLGLRAKTNCTASCASAARSTALARWRACRSAPVRGRSPMDLRGILVLPGIPNNAVATDRHCAVADIVALPVCDGRDAVVDDTVTQGFRSTLLCALQAIGLELVAPRAGYILDCDTEHLVSLRSVLMTLVALREGTRKHKVA